MFFNTMLFSEMQELHIFGEAKQLHDFLIPDNRRDDQGNLSACLIVNTDVLVDISFVPEKDLVGITREGNERYYVFLNHEETKINVYAFGFKPFKISLSDLGIERLISGSAYEVTLTTYEPEHTIIIEEKEIIINVTPESANLIINGVEKGGLRKILVPLGKNRIKIEKIGYDTIYKEIFVDLDSTYYNFAMQRSTKHSATKREIYDEPNETSQVKFEMIFVQGGIMDKGNNSIILDSFFIGKYPVTQLQWKSIFGKNPSHHRRGIGDYHPVNSVSWVDAIIFCNLLSIKKKLTPVYSVDEVVKPEEWFAIIMEDENAFWDNLKANWDADGYRLPTSAEWFYAAMGGEFSQNYFYSGSNNINEVAWYNGNSNRETQKIGQKKPNELGLFDMSGNVWEWCWDWHGPIFSGSTAINPRGPEKGSLKISRGGAWNSVERLCLIWHKHSSPPEATQYFIGLRLARSYSN